MWDSMESFSWGWSILAVAWLLANPFQQVLPVAVAVTDISGPCPQWSIWTDIAYGVISCRERVAGDRNGFSALERSWQIVLCSLRVAAALTTCYPHQVASSMQFMFIWCGRVLLFMEIGQVCQILPHWNMVLWRQVAREVGTWKRLNWG